MNVLGNPAFSQLLDSAPTLGRERRQNLDWDVYGEALNDAGFSLTDVRTLSWARFSEVGVGALTEGTSLIAVFNNGIFESLGKRRLMSRSPKYRAIDFEQVAGYGDVDHVVEHHRIFKYCIEFQGAGSILLGRLEWHVQGKRFGDNRQEIMATARERDRVLSVINEISGN
ncbi:hypothetical protein DKT68_09905 [Micromonospora acroterricola]|uniref:Uncharacterized protein n=1 Tax=Micromonospora acroterricola TaxID=2202421 RepID=A0A317D7S4_9ACTN|nr:hypothetical protein [Micromonospora acroterricola]PWR10180.1 hypothetical protein DKT68_09905 [Micromonospora acroterricola]